MARKESRRELIARFDREITLRSHLPLLIRVFILAHQMQTFAHTGVHYDPSPGHAGTLHPDLPKLLALSEQSSFRFIRCIAMHIWRPITIHQMHDFAHTGVHHDPSLGHAGTLHPDLPKLLASSTYELLASLFEARAKAVRARHLMKIPLMDCHGNRFN